MSKVVLISSKTMGDGEEALGEKLMKAFIYSLTEAPEMPSHVIMYNNGAFLSQEGSEAVEDLKNLESQGVEILTCGTCLDHYGITDKLAVGEVTNMYVIADKLTGATNVVRP